MKFVNNKMCLTMSIMRLIYAVDPHGKINISKTFNIKKSSYGFLFDIDIIMKQL